VQPENLTQMKRANIKKNHIKAKRQICFLHNKQGVRTITL